MAQQLRSAPGLLVANDPAAVGLTQADADTLTALADAYDALFDAANNPITRTSGVIAPLANCVRACRFSVRGHRIPRRGRR